MINNPLDPELLTRILKLSTADRAGIWASLGQRSLSEQDLIEIIVICESADSEDAALQSGARNTGAARNSNELTHPLRPN